MYLRSRVPTKYKQVSEAKPTINGSGTSMSIVLNVYFAANPENIVTQLQCAPPAKAVVKAVMFHSC